MQMWREWSFLGMKKKPVSRGEEDGRIMPLARESLILFHGLSFQVEEVIQSAEWQGSPREQVYGAVVWAMRWEGEDPVLAKDLSQDMVLREPERSREPKDE